MNGPTSQKHPRTIDLYSGIGGWTLGLSMAGIDVVDSYEWWGEALATHDANFRTDLRPIDIRSLDLNMLPKSLDFVVGSPPCTQFSYSNRGGNGDIDDGLRDIKKFLEIVDAVGPRGWIMENVPRVALILEHELGPGGRLRKFKNLVKEITVVDMAEYGLPQRRSRMLAGDFSLELLESYRNKSAGLCLGDVIESLSADPVVDPNYGFSMGRSELTENEVEQFLDAEEVRMNREAKEYHPVYNRMKFPDPLDATSRTVTALCTRISRESIVVRHGRKFRRLTLRERATLQGFPITFELHGRSYQSKIKMIGNAFPPVMTYFAAHALLETPSDDVKQLVDLGHVHPRPHLPSPVTPPPPPKRRFSPSRRFRAAVPGLRFGSGMRFELVNDVDKAGIASWYMNFYFGNSKSFKRIELGTKLLDRVRTQPLRKRLWTDLRSLERKAALWTKEIDPVELQRVWTRKAKGTHPFEVVDELASFAAQAHEVIRSVDPPKLEDAVIHLVDSNKQMSSAAQKKLRQHASWILAGFLVGSWFNVRKKEALKLAV